MSETEPQSVGSHSVILRRSSMLDQQLETGGHVVVWTLQRQILLLPSSRQDPPLDSP